ncbi:MAG: ATP-binding cassette domain-containing protein, partial [Clostridium sp.]
NYSIGESLIFGSLPKSLTKGTRYFKQEEEMRKRANYLMEYMGFNDKRDLKASNLPYGQQRKLEIARALALKPKLLLLDEPAAGMNPEETTRLTKMIIDIKNEFDLSILLIEHHMDLVMEICNKIVVLNFGSNLAEGIPREIQENPKVREAYLGGGE